MKFDLLELPKQLVGKWKNAVFLTYGVDLLFFERVVWQDNWRNIIIIGDGQQLFRSLQSCKGGDDVRWANRKYVVDGVYGTTYHPKMILLTTPNSGRMFIGSGNLGFSGYASGGEMFVQYDYDPEHTEFISAFNYARGYLDELISGHYLRPRTEKQLEKLFEDSPWLYHGFGSESESVRSNSEKPFMEHFINKIDEDPVESLRILTPFYDEKLIALKRLIKELNPKYTEILLQEGQTSIDPNVLQELIKTSDNKIVVKLIEVDEDNTYIHNKLYVATTKHKAICLQGSPNLSISAFLRMPPEGNFELGNILVGQRDEYNPLFERLSITDISCPVSQLNLKIDRGVEDEIQEFYASSPFWVVGAEWEDDRFTIFFKGQLEEPSNVVMEIVDVQYPLNVKEFEANSIQAELSIEVQNLLSRNFTIRFLFDGEYKSAPILPFNVKELDKSINVSEDGENLNKVGDLDLDDKDFEALLHELDGSLIIDGKSVVNLWQAIGNKTEDIDWDDDNAVRIAYEEIDYDLLRSHPKLEQYRTWSHGSGSTRKTDLQVILSSITSHFQGLIDTAQGKQKSAEPEIRPDQSDSGPENPEEAEEEEGEREKRKWSSDARKRNIMRSFIRRYLKGISSTEFLKIVDYDVIANNYVIFSHVLWRLFSFDWMDDEFVAKSALAMLQFMWGDGNSKKGYFHRLDEEGKTLCRDIIGKSQGFGRLIAIVYYIDYLLNQTDKKDCRLELRNFLRHILVSKPIEITNEILMEAWVFLGSMFIYNPPIPSDIIARLDILANWETHDLFLRNLEKKVGIREEGCRFSPMPVSVMRPAVREVIQIRQLEFNDITGIDNQESVEMVCRIWMSYQLMDFYRITDTQGMILFLYDRVFKKGLYVHREKGIDVDIKTLTPYKNIVLDNRIEELKEIARQAEEKIKVSDFSLVY